MAKPRTAKQKLTLERANAQRKADSLLAKIQGGETGKAEEYAKTMAKLHDIEARLQSQQPEAETHTFDEPPKAGEVVTVPPTPAKESKAENEGGLMTLPDGRQYVIKGDKAYPVEIGVDMAKPGAEETVIEPEYNDIELPNGMIARSYVDGKTEVMTAKEAGMKIHEHVEHPPENDRPDAPEQHAEIFEVMLEPQYARFVRNWSQVITQERGIEFSPAQVIAKWVKTMYADDPTKGGDVTPQAGMAVKNEHLGLI